MSILTSWDVIKYVKASAGRAGLGVVFEDVDEPKHDGNTIYLPAITSKTTARDLQRLMASTDHEVGHDLYSDFEIIKKAKISAKDSLLGFVWNIIEDSRVNSLEADEYYGFRQLFDDVNSESMERVAKKFKPTDKIMKALSSIVHWDIDTNRERFPKVSTVTNKFIIDKDHEKNLYALTDELNECREEFTKIKGSRASYEVAKKALVACGFTEEELGTKEIENRMDDKGKEPSEEEKEKQKAYKEALEKLVGEMEKEGIKLHNEEFYAQQESRGAPASCDREAYIVSDNVAVSNFITGELHHFHTKRGSKRWGEEFKPGIAEVKAASVSSEGFSQQVRRLLQILSRVKYERGVKKGRIDQARLSRICLKDAQGFNERIFKRKISSHILDAAVTLLVDTSGSMAGTKYYNATEAALLVNDAISNALHIPVEVLGFSDHTSTPTMFIHKTFDSKVNEEQLIESMGKAACYMSGNPDGESILWAYNRLVKRKERKKVLIVFSDGAPASGKQGDIHAFTKQVIREIEKEKIVDIYGIGIQSFTVEGLYTHQCVIKQASDISIKLLEVIEQKLLSNV